MVHTTPPNIPQHLTSRRWLPLCLGSALLLAACSDPSDPDDQTDSGEASGPSETGDSGEVSSTSSDASATGESAEASESEDSAQEESESSTDGIAETTGDGDGDGDTTGDGDADAPDFEEPGPHVVTSQAGSLATPNGCQLDYERFTPDTIVGDATVLLSHGFMRSVADMADMAEHAASFGVEVIVLSLCTNSFVNMDHALNGEAMAEAGLELAPGSRVYSGFSAGGLAALVAASQDQETIAFVGLDAVDSDGLGAALAPNLAARVYSMLANSGQCNENNNLLPVLTTVAGARVIRIVDAEHFDFEADSCAAGDLGCSFCMPTGGEVHSMARAMTAAALAWVSNAQPQAASWWEPGGSVFEQLENTGRIQGVL